MFFFFLWSRFSHIQVKRRNLCPLISMFLVMLKIGAMISEGHDLGKAAPVVYVSGEEVRFDSPSLFYFLLL